MATIATMLPQSNVFVVIEVANGTLKLLVKEALPRTCLCWLARESKLSWFNNKILVHYCKSRTI